MAQRPQQAPQSPATAPQSPATAPPSPATAPQSPAAAQNPSNPPQPADEPGGAPYRNARDVPSTWPPGPSALTSNTRWLPLTAIAVSKPDLARLATGFSAEALEPARTCQRTTWVAPFQL